MDDKQKAAIKRIWAAQDSNHELEAFWQDHFYSTEKRFGYPVCVHLVNTLTGQVEDSVIVGYFSAKASCESHLEQVEAYIAELVAETKDICIPDSEDDFLQVGEPDDPEGEG